MSMNKARTLAISFPKDIQRRASNLADRAVMIFSGRGQNEEGTCQTPAVNPGEPRNTAVAALVWNRASREAFREPLMSTRITQQRGQSRLNNSILVKNLRKNSRLSLGLLFLHISQRVGCTERRALVADCRNSLKRRNYSFLS